MDSLTNAQNADVSNYVLSTTRQVSDRGTLAPISPQPSTPGGKSVSVNTNAFLANSLNQAQQRRVSGASGKFTSADGKTVTVVNGLVTSIV